MIDLLLNNGRLLRAMMASQLLVGACWAQVAPPTISGVRDLPGDEIEVAWDEPTSGPPLCYIVAVEDLSPGAEHWLEFGGERFLVVSNQQTSAVVSLEGGGLHRVLVGSYDGQEVHYDSSLEPSYFRGTGVPVHKPKFTAWPRRDLGEAIEVRWQPQRSASDVTVYVADFDTRWYRDVADDLVEYSADGAQSSAIITNLPTMGDYGVALVMNDFDGTSVTSRYGLVSLTRSFLDPSTEPFAEMPPPEVAALDVHIKSKREPPPNAVFVRAEDFTGLAAGQPGGLGAWDLTTGGVVSVQLDFPVSGAYVFLVGARGDRTKAEWPVMSMAVDGEGVVTSTVNKEFWSTCSFRQVVLAGRHELSVAYINDNGSSDQGLHLSYLTVVPPPGAPPVRRVTPDRARALQAVRQQLAEESEGAVNSLRKGRVRIKVQDASGESPGRVRVNIRQVRHDFRFGTVLCSDAFNGSLPKTTVERYLDLVATYFNYVASDATVPWRTKDLDANAIRFDVFDRILAWGQQHHVTVQGPVLFGEQPESIPDDVKTLNDFDLQTLIQQRAREIAKRYSGRIRDYVVSRDAFHFDYLRRRLGAGVRWEMFGEAHAVAPEATLYISDYNVLNGVHRDRFMTEVRRLLDAHVPVGGIALQAEWDVAVDPVQLREGLDEVATLGLPVLLTDVTCTVNDEQVQAQSLEDVLRTAFAHPAVRGVILRDFWQGCSRNPKVGLLREDFASTPASAVYEQLVLDQWWTDVSGQTDSEGVFEAQAFFGDLRITVTAPDGHEVSEVVALDPLKGKGVYILDLPAATSPPARSPTLKATPRAPSLGVTDTSPTSPSTAEPVSR